MAEAKMDMVKRSRLEQARLRLLQHEVYSRLTDLNNVALFMETHVFAVWDFMSLTKKLQSDLTCVTVPWLPPKDADACRFINEIVLSEESDVDPQGGYVSHYELYLRAMSEVGASSVAITEMIEQLRNGNDIHTVLNDSSLPKHVREFLDFTFRIIEIGKPHEIAAAFTFGREDIIPEMFDRLLKTISTQPEQDYPSFSYYLHRHIEIDGDEHGPMAEKLLELLCGEDELKWKEAVECAVEALEHRIMLWDGALRQLSSTPISTSAPHFNYR